MYKRMSKNLVYFFILIIASGIININTCYGSSIPIWELLSRNEKLAHLYTIFAKQVSDYCKTNTVTSSKPIAQCKHELLNYGLNQLHSFSNNHLDLMDPSQRRFNELIWEMIMKDHEYVKINLPQNIHSNDNFPYNLGSSSSPTIILGNINHDSSSNTQYPNNPIFNEQDHTKKQTSSQSYAMEMDTIYGNHYQAPIDIIKTNVPSINNVENNNKNHHYNNNNNNHNNNKDSIIVYENNEDHQKTSYLTGPMIVRVRLDGTPVEEDRNKPLPYDDDREQMQFAYVKIPDQVLQPRLFNYNYEKIILPRAKQYKRI